ncbi:MAG: hypothetical protein JSW62_00725 [Thermoplasmatales archaeon]|nr:MAG: hypothetical protein JSW62_00725 [Thermoplasmatales archaeon]
MQLINKITFAFLTIIIVFAISTVFIFCFYVENVLAEDITYAKYTCTLTVGTDTKDTHSSSPPPHPSYSSFLQRLIDRFLHLARLIQCSVFDKLLDLQ